MESISFVIGRRDERPDIREPGAVSSSHTLVSFQVILGVKSQSLESVAELDMFCESPDTTSQRETNAGPNMSCLLTGEVNTII